jgi:hypothetical protein
MAGARRQGWGQFCAIDALADALGANGTAFRAAWVRSRFLSLLCDSALAPALYTEVSLVRAVPESR